MSTSTGLKAREIIMAQRPYKTNRHTIRGQCERLKKGRFGIGSREALTPKEEHQRIAHRVIRHLELEDMKMDGHLRMEIHKMEARKRKEDIT